MGEGRAGWAEGAAALQPSFPRKRESRTVLKDQPFAVQPPPDSRLRGNDGKKRGVQSRVAPYRHSRVSGIPNGTENTSPLPSNRRRVPAYAGMTVENSGRTVERVRK